MKRKRIAIGILILLFIGCLALYYQYNKIKEKQTYRMQEKEIILPEEVTLEEIVEDDEYTQEDWEADEKLMQKRLKS